MPLILELNVDLAKESEKVKEEIQQEPCATNKYTFQSTLSSVENRQGGTSLVAQWLRIRLPLQGTRVRALVRENPTCCRATKPVCHNY
ncbi:hypothetical protein J1605_022399 [Eschrichtius robustus]|uniref:Uncharacterized protein n=1 Tax=Eschrichtius robustus TaxID=9764 RepID=A0AB34HAI6_ESCRO|nr:hypothetical protein J1605_022399 [Eschrichtius robustus]